MFLIYVNELTMKNSVSSTAKLLLLFAELAEKRFPLDGFTCPIFVRKYETGVYETLIVIAIRFIIDCLWDCACNR